MDMYDWITVGAGLISACLWLASAFVKWPFGFDMDRKLQKAAAASSKLNAAAAIFTAISVIVPVWQKAHPVHQPSPTASQIKADPKHQ